MNDRQIVDVFEAFTFFKNYKVLPSGGGLYDQTPFFVKAVRFCEQVIGTLDKMNQDHNDKIKTMAKRRKTEGAINGKD